MAEHWAVTVERSGEKIVTIESNCLSGRDLSPEDEETIRTAAHHLLAFIGDPAAGAREVCGACGEPWTEGKTCGQKDNGWPFQVCYPMVFAVAPDEQAHTRG
jgi:hypothetical protein